MKSSPRSSSDGSCGGSGASSDKFYLPPINFDNKDDGKHLDPINHEYIL